jgi:hypothetical protein
MDDAHTALPGGVCLRHELLYDNLRLFNRVAVQVALPLHGEIAAMQALSQAMIDTRRHALHVFIRALNGKSAAPFNEVT